MFAGDMLLYYTPEDFTYDPKSSAEEKIKAIIDVMKSLPAKRVMAGGMIGPIAAFLYCVGFYHIVLMTNDQAHTLAFASFLLSCFGIITGGAYHSHCSYLGLLGDDKDKDALDKVMKYFQKLPLILYAGETDLSIQDIAGKIGFENPNKFSSAFRSHFGMPPTEYKKSVRMDRNV